MELTFGKSIASTLQVGDPRSPSCIILWIKSGLNAVKPIYEHSTRELPESSSTPEVTEASEILYITDGSDAPRNLSLLMHLKHLKLPNQYLHRRPNPRCLSIPNHLQLFQKPKCMSLPRLLKQLQNHNLKWILGASNSMVDSITSVAESTMESDVRGAPEVSQSTEESEDFRT